MVEIVTDNKNRIATLRSSIKELRYTYAQMQPKFTADEWVVVGNAYKVIAGYHAGEIARAKHAMRDYILGVDDDRPLEDHNLVHDIETAINDIIGYKQNIDRYESNSSQSTYSEATLVLNIEGEKSNIKNKLELIKRMTDLLEDKIYAGQ